VKFGNSITYGDDPFSHTKTEFGFDVFQAAKKPLPSAAYKNFIGFQVAKPVLERAFQDTYGIRIEQVFLRPLCCRILGCSRHYATVDRLTKVP